MRVLRVVLVVASLLVAHIAQAATYWVVDSAGSGGGTLSYAIANAQASPDAENTITFSAALDGATITLTTGYSNDTTTGSKEFGPSAFFIDQSKTLTIDASAGGFVHGVTLARDTVRRITPVRRPRHLTSACSTSASAASWCCAG